MSVGTVSEKKSTLIKHHPVKSPLPQERSSIESCYIKQIYPLHDRNKYGEAQDVEYSDTNV